jgi:tetratricopeptide (TPR) repeat protein
MRITVTTPPRAAEWMAVGIAVGLSASLRGDTPPFASKKGGGENAMNALQTNCIFRLGVIAAAFQFATVGRALADDWTGLAVYPRAEKSKLRYVFDDVGNFSFEARVTRDLGDWIEVRHGEGAGPYMGCCLKSEAVRPAEASEYFTKRLRSNPKDAWALKCRARVHLARGDRVAATADFDEAIRLAPDGTTFIARGSTWHARGDFDRAIKDFGDALRLEPENAIAFNNRGAAREARGDLDPAIKDFDEALRLDPKLAIAFNARGVLRSRKGDHDGALRDLDAALGLDPGLAPAYAHRGRVLSAKGQFDRAIDDFDQALRFDSKQVAVLASRGEAWKAKNDADRAISDFDKALRLDPGNIGLLTSRGDVLQEKSEFDRAIKDYDEALRLDPRRVEALASRGAARREKGDYDRAIKDFDAAIVLDPRDPSIRFDRAVALLMARKPGAAAGFKSVIDAGGHRGERAEYAVILGCLSARIAGDKKDAARFLDESRGKLAENWPYPVVRHLRGEIDAAALLAASVDRDKQTETHCYLGYIDLLENRRAAALTHFRWVKENGSKEFLEHHIAVAELARLERSPQAVQSKK